MADIVYPVSFDGVQLTTISGLQVLSTNPYLPPKRVLTIGDIARRDKSSVSSAFYKEKRINVKVGISRATRPLLETSLDALWTILQGKEKDLILPQSGSTRKYITTYEDAVVGISGGSYIQMDLIFRCSDNFGYDIAKTLLLQATSTSQNGTAQITVGGSAPTQLPIFTLTYTAATGASVDSSTIRIANDRAGQVLAITSTVVAGDLFVIDVPNQSVTKNGVEIAFSGAFPEYAPGINYIAYSDTVLSARTFSLRIDHYRRYV